MNKWIKKQIKAYKIKKQINNKINQLVLEADALVSKEALTDADLSILNLTIAQLTKLVNQRDNRHT